MRAIQLAPLILREKPDLALSHGSRSQIVLSSLLGIPSLAITDYEHAKMRMGSIRPQWLMVPEVVSNAVAQADYECVLTYPGIKEDVYVPRFRPTPGIREELGFTKEDVVVTIRPPASDAHYHNPMSDGLFRDVVEFLGNINRVRMVMLPRNKNQATSLRGQWPRLITTSKIVIPDHAVDGLNLMWFSDLVISGGGTMNREAAALGVPVYSIFRGKPAAVDRYLAANGRLMLLENRTDLETIRLVRREPPQNPNFHRSSALTRIVENVIATVELTRL
jgi:predicted glycosyltransferase